ncbi:MAG: hypothetical protein RBR54_05095 [Sulfurimonas sp.]|jgi:hypothetical protein|nr:hypothetical protein [Sulfurimonas sp.]
MKKWFVLSLSLVASMLVMGCSSDSDGGSAPYTVSGEAADINDKRSAENAVATLKSMGLAADGMSEFNNVILAEGGSGSPSYLRSVATPRETLECSGGGSYTLSGSETETSINGQVAFNACIEDGETINGTLGLVGTMDNEHNIDLTTTFSNITIVSMDSSDRINLTMNMQTNLDTFDPLSLTLRGESKIGQKTYGYENFIMSVANYNDTLEDFNEYEINGKTSFISEDSDFSCANGTYTVSTTETMIRDTTLDGFSSGIVEVNGVTIEFASGGAATVTYANGTSQQIHQKNSILCGDLPL